MSTITSYANDIYVTTRIEVETCCNCGITFGLASEFKAQRLRDARTWYCPNGHGQHYTANTPSEAEKLRKQLESSRTYQRSILDQKAAAERSNRALKGVVTRTKKRAANGVCPCCTRTFQNLARHIEGQHPEFVEAHR